MSAEDTTTKTAKFDWSRFDAKTDAEVHAAAMRDPDAQPLSDEEFARVKRVPRARTLRRALGFTPGRIRDAVSIPLGTLRDWEQGGRSQISRPDLKAIAGDPEAILRALGATTSEQG